jgi:hypothetical protein
MQIRACYPVAFDPHLLRSFMEVWMDDARMILVDTNRVRGTVDRDSLIH